MTSSAYMVMFKFGKSYCRLILIREKISGPNIDRRGIPLVKQPVSEYVDNFNIGN